MIVQNIFSESIIGERQHGLLPRPSLVRFDSIDVPGATFGSALVSIYGAEDSACPQCGTVFVLPAVTPEARVAELALSILGAEASAKISKY